MSARRHPDERRESARGPLYMLVQTQDGGEPLWASDIGLGGLRCTGRPVWPGTYLGLSFALPDDRERIEVGAQVVSLAPRGDPAGIPGSSDDVELGLRFCRISDGARLAIYRLLDRRRPLWSTDDSLGPTTPFAPRPPE